MRTPGSIRRRLMAKSMYCARDRTTIPADRRTGCAQQHGRTEDEPDASDGVTANS